MSGQLAWVICAGVLVQEGGETFSGISWRQIPNLHAQKRYNSSSSRNSATLRESTPPRLQARRKLPRITVHHHPLQDPGIRPILLTIQMTVFFKKNTTERISYTINLLELSYMYAKSLHRLGDRRFLHRLKYNSSERFRCICLTHDLTPFSAG